jgi:phosphopantothenoylcysteine decarboxylase/phosphopantothenate--cysteine ligase
LANVVVGVTGGIAAYKSASLIRLLTESGHNVQVVATVNATRFIGKATLEALSQSKVEIVDPDLFSDVEIVKHVGIAKSADLIIVAPATASFVAKVSAGLADDLLTTTVLTASCPVVIAPAMHTEMWLNSATRQNIATLESRGFTIVNPGVGRLTGEDTGIGRLAEPAEIFQSATSLLGAKQLDGVRILVTAGGTREKIDPARFIGNFSSGKQGLAFASASKDMGAAVTVIAANVDPSLLHGLSTISVVSTSDLESKMRDALGSFDVLVMAAAVSDYIPVHVSSGKIKRAATGEKFDLALRSNPDLLSSISSAISARGDSVLIIGFAAESETDMEDIARKKLVAKGCDYIVANNIGSGEVFNSESNSILLVSSGESSKFSGSKYEVAKAVLEIVSSKVVKRPTGDNQ